MKKCLSLLFLTLFIVSCSKKMVIGMKYNGHINLNLKLGNKALGNFMFDTGSPYLCIDSLFYVKRGFNESNTIDVSLGGVGNSKVKGKSFKNPICFELSDKRLYFSTKSCLLNLKSTFGGKTDGIAGIKTFEKRSPYMIDYVSQKIVFMDSIKGYDAVDAQFINSRIFLHLPITLQNGKKIEGKFLVDTGAGNSYLNSSLFKTDGIFNNNEKIKYYSRGGIGDKSDGYRFFVKNVNVGKYSIKDVNLQVSTDTLGMLSDHEYLGIIGNDLLDDFNVVFDHQKGKMWVKPNKNFNKNKGFLFRSFSAIDRTDIKKGWIVSSIAENTDAFDKGLQLDDVIMQINHVPVENIDYEKFFKKLKPNKSLCLKIKRGSEEKEIKFKLNVFLKS